MSWNDLDWLYDVGFKSMCHRKWRKAVGSVVCVITETRQNKFTVTVTDKVSYFFGVLTATVTYTWENITICEVRDLVDEFGWS